MARSEKLDDDDYWRLLEFRTAIRKFLKYSQSQAAQLGLTPAQHQLLLAIRGARRTGGPTIGDIADCLLIRHHSAVELVDRAETAGLVQRRQDRDDQRVIRLALTRSGRSKLERISAANLTEIGRLGPEFSDVWKAIERLSQWRALIARRDLLALRACVTNRDRGRPPRAMVCATNIGGTDTCANVEAATNCEA